MLGFLVGTAIAGQTFYNFTIENIKQFGALKAMGMTNLADCRDDPFAGHGCRFARLRHRRRPGGLFGWRVKGTELAFFTPWQLLPITAAAIVLICILASLLCVQKVIRLEPAIVFR